MGVFCVICLPKRMKIIVKMNNGFNHIWNWVQVRSTNIVGCKVNGETKTLYQYL